MLTRVTRLASRSFATTALRVVNDVAKQQFYVSMEGQEAYIGYEKCGKHILYDTTQVPEYFQGKGVGKLLAKHVFDYAKEHNLDVTIGCHFLEKFYEKNKEKYKCLNVKIDIKEDEDQEERRWFATTALRVVNDVAKQQFYVSMEGQEAYIGYEKCGKHILYDTTQVPEYFQGKGVGKLLAKHAFDYAKEHNLDVTIGCHFLENFYEKNKEKYKCLNVKIDIKEDEDEEKPKK